MGGVGELSEEEAGQRQGLEDLCLRAGMQVKLGEV